MVTLRTTGLVLVVDFVIKFGNASKACSGLEGHRSNVSRSTYQSSLPLARRQ
jgi:hypothetical protein